MLSAPSLFLLEKSSMGISSGSIFCTLMEGMPVGMYTRSSSSVLLRHVFRGTLLVTHVSKLLAKSVFWPREPGTATARQSTEHATAAATESTMMLSLH